MARFNQNVVSNGAGAKTSNYEGGEAYNLTPELDLYTKVCTASLQSKFYEPNVSQQLGTLRSTIAKVDAELVCKMAVYAREKMHLRSIPLVLLVELFKNFEDGKQKGKRDGTLLKKTTSRVIQRADEITELLAYYLQANGRKQGMGPNGVQNKVLNKLPNAMKKGIAEAFRKFDEYQLAKYNRDHEVSLKDALFLSHAKPLNAEEKRHFYKLASDNLDVPHTWEVEFTKLGSQKYASDVEKNKAFSTKWAEMINSGDLGYMAMLRNLRNILKYGASKDLVKEICEQISDSDSVHRSKQLPFRFWSAYNELTAVQQDFDTFAVKKVLAALEKAVLASVDNLEGFDDDTRVLVACDVSGSMQKNVSEKSKVQYYDIGLLLGQLLQSKCANVITGFFGNSWKVVNLTSDNILQNTMELRRREGEVGYSTNGHKVIEWLVEKKMAVDKVMIFTDCQMWDSERMEGSISKAWDKYRALFPKAKLYLFDMAGYGTTPLQIRKDKGVHLIAGWSDKIFEVLSAMEKGGDAVSMIREKIVL